MNNGISYNQAGITIDPAELSAYVIACIQDNNENNGGKTSE